MRLLSINCGALALFVFVLFFVSLPVWQCPTANGVELKRDSAPALYAAYMPVGEQPCPKITALRREESGRLYFRNSPFSFPFGVFVSRTCLLAVFAAYAAAEIFVYRCWTRRVKQLSRSASTSDAGVDADSYASALLRFFSLQRREDIYNFLLYAFFSSVKVEELYRCQVIDWLYCHCRNQDVGELIVEEFESKLGFQFQRLPHDPKMRQDIVAKFEKGWCYGTFPINAAYRPLLLVALIHVMHFCCTRVVLQFMLGFERWKPFDQELRCSIRYYTWRPRTPKAPSWMQRLWLAIANCCGHGRRGQNKKRENGKGSSCYAATASDAAALSEVVRGTRTEPEEDQATAKVRTEIDADRGGRQNCFRDKDAVGAASSNAGGENSSWVSTKSQLPILFVHGFGCGLVPYIPAIVLLWARERLFRAKGRPLIFPEFLWLGVMPTGRCARDVSLWIEIMLLDARRVWDVVRRGLLKAAHLLALPSSLFAAVAGVPSSPQPADAEDNARTDGDTNRGGCRSSTQLPSMPAVVDDMRTFVEYFVVQSCPSLPPPPFTTAATPTTAGDDRHHHGHAAGSQDQHDDGKYKGTVPVAGEARTGGGGGIGAIGPVKRYFACQQRYGRCYGFGDPSKTETGDRAATAAPSWESSGSTGGVGRGRRSADLAMTCDEDRSLSEACEHLLGSRTPVSARREDVEREEGDVALGGGTEETESPSTATGHEKGFVTVIGHSYGTSVVSLLHRAYPSFARRCILLDPICFLPQIAKQVK
eukprot:GHVU01212556.1.p1 GENE.GHVU01212556.1~~GHVU01212556.1.p1  ORF type:complete len:761 (+),score=54.23 GHVU01212556.1:111-2393(+)